MSEWPPLRYITEGSTRWQHTECHCCWANRNSVQQLWFRTNLSWSSQTLPPHTFPRSSERDHGKPSLPSFDEPHIDAALTPAIQFEPRIPGHAPHNWWTIHPLLQVTIRAELGGVLRQQWAERMAWWPAWLCWWCGPPLPHERVSGGWVDDDWVRSFLHSAIALFC